MIKNIKQFFTVDIWTSDITKLSNSKFLMFRTLKIIILAIKGFAEDHCQLRASALTFYSVFSIVPVAAMIFGIAKGFGVDQSLKSQLYERFAEHQAVLEKVFVFAESTLRDTRSGMVAGVGVVILFWTVIKLIGNIESSFNHIWGVKTDRPFFRKFSDYMSLVVICPILIIMAGSATVLISAQLNRVVDNVIILKAFGSPLTLTIIKLVPFFTAWILFSFIYGFMPNTRVSWRSALIAGIAAGTCYQLLQESYIIIQVALSRYNTIYGSFSALPLFLLWLQLSWLIVLFGAEISFAHQNIDTYESEINAAKINYSFKKKLIIQVATSVVQQFQSQSGMPDDIEVAQHCNLPIRQVRDILYTLHEAGIILKTEDYKANVIRYAPAIPPEKLTIQMVLEKIESCGDNFITAPDNEIFNKISKSMSGIAESARSSTDNRLLKELV